MNKRVFLTPVEVEAEMQKAREKDGFNGKVEETAVKTMIETALHNGRYGDKDLMVISPEYIHVPIWQRKLRISKALNIGNDYDRHKWEVPKFYILTGNYTLLMVCIGYTDRLKVESIR